MRVPLCLLVLGTELVVSCFVWATDIRGTIVNGTTKKPATGDEVALLSLSQERMRETAHATADVRGQFSLPLPDPEVAHVVRVTHEGVTYHRVIEAGAKRFVVEVFEVVSQLEGVSAIMDVQRLETIGDELEVKQLITVRNESQPPRTLMNDRPFEIQLPVKARVQSGLVQVGDGQPLKQKPVAGDPQGQYYFAFPIRPGDTRFAVVYRVPYTGAALIEPQIRNPLERFVVMLPKTMEFEPKVAGIFHPMTGTTPDNVQGTSPVHADQILAFRVSGTGMLEELEGRRQEVLVPKPDSTPRPGGGLGVPIDAPDPLQHYRLPILVGLIGLMIIGVIYVERRSRLRYAEASPQFRRKTSSERVKKEAFRRSMNRRHRRRAHV